MSHGDHLPSVVRSTVHTFERLLLLSPWANFLQTSCGAFCQREIVIYRNGHDPLIKMAAMPIHGQKTKTKKLKKLLLQNHVRFEAEPYYVATGTQDPPNLFN